MCKSIGIGIAYFNKAPDTLLSVNFSKYLFAWLLHTYRNYLVKYNISRRYQNHRSQSHDDGAHPRGFKCLLVIVVCHCIFHQKSILIGPSNNVLILVNVMAWRFLDRSFIWTNDGWPRILTNTKAIWGSVYTKMELLQSQHRYLSTFMIMSGMKLLIHSQT